MASNLMLSSSFFPINFNSKHVETGNVLEMSWSSNWSSRLAPSRNLNWRLFILACVSFYFSQICFWILAKIPRTNRSLMQNARCFSTKMLKTDSESSCNQWINFTTNSTQQQIWCGSRFTVSAEWKTKRGKSPQHLKKDISLEYRRERSCP